jgi:hypothetical protein
MNRLTDDQVADGIKIIVDGLIEAGAEPAMSDRRYVRLAEYEQTGLSPEQIKELQHQVDGMDISQNENTVINLAKIADCDEFKCSKCGIQLSGWTRVEEEDNDVSHFEYEFKYCPECGRRIAVGGGD